MNKDTNEETPEKKNKNPQATPSSGSLMHKLALQIN